MGEAILWQTLCRRKVCARRAFLQLCEVHWCTEAGLHRGKTVAGRNLLLFETEILDQLRGRRE